VALLLRDVKLPFPNHGHVVLCQPSPVLFYPISSKEVCSWACCVCVWGGGVWCSVVDWAWQGIRKRPHTCRVCIPRVHDHRSKETVTVWGHPVS
jgi:hypothetical protein